METNDKKLIYIAHRGFRVGVDENTFHAFNKSIEQGMDYIELDIQLSADNFLIVHHDTTLDRMYDIGPNTNVHLEHKMLNYLKSIKSRNFEYSLPLLTEVFDTILLGGCCSDGIGIISNSPIKLMIELKGVDTGKEIVKIINGYKESTKNFLCKNIVFSGRNMKELKEAHEGQPNVPICLNITSCKEFNIDDLFETQKLSELPLPFKFISLRSSMIFDKEYSSKCHQLGIKALTWDFMNYSEPAEKIRELIDIDIDGVLFDSAQSVEEIRKPIELILE